MTLHVMPGAESSCSCGSVGLAASLSLADCAVHSQIVLCTDHALHVLPCVML
jgi:hypothetical protein